MTKISQSQIKGGGGGGGDATSIQTTAVEGPATVVGDTLIYDGAQYVVRQLTMDDILPSFAISSFNCGTAAYVLLGATVTHPTFTASYATAPTSVTIHDNAGNPTVDETATPTSFTYLYNYTKNTYGQSVSFTLTAIQGAITKTASAGITWVQPVYYGIGAAGESSAAFIQSLTGSLATSRNKTFTVSPGAAQYIYYAYRTAYGVATFTVGGFEGGFNVVSTTIAVTNTNGITENYTLYVSAQPDLGSTTVVVT